MPGVRSGKIIPDKVDQIARIIVLSTEMLKVFVVLATGTPCVYENDHIEVTGADFVLDIGPKLRLGISQHSAVIV